MISVLGEKPDAETGQKDTLYNLIGMTKHFLVVRSFRRVINGIQIPVWGLTRGSSSTKRGPGNSELANVRNHINTQSCKPYVRPSGRLEKDDAWDS